MRFGLGSQAMEKVNCLKNLRFYFVLDSINKQFLLERHLMSIEHTENRAESGVG